MDSGGGVIMPFVLLLVLLLLFAFFRLCALACFILLSFPIISIPCFLFCLTVVFGSFFPIFLGFPLIVAVGGFQLVVITCLIRSYWQIGRASCRKRVCQYVYLSVVS